MVSNHVPSADQYPRRSAGRKGAYGVAMRWRQRPPCPRHHDEHRGQDQGNGAGAGSDSVNERTRSPCPPRALQGRHSRSFTANHGQSKPLLTGFVLGMSCSSQALNENHRRLRWASAPGRFPRAEARWRGTSDPDRKTRPHPGRAAGCGRASPMTTEQKASSPSPVRSERHVRELRWDRGLIFGFIRLRSPTFIGFSARLRPRRWCTESSPLSGVVS
jgi:hypothetical protein